MFEKVLFVKVSPLKRKQNLRCFRNEQLTRCETSNRCAIPPSNPVSTNSVVELDDVKATAPT